MHETELYDLSDDADYAASMQQGSISMTANDSSRKSSSTEPEGAEIVYVKDNVTIHPTQYAAERISGRLKLIKQGTSLFLTWIPYKGQSSNAGLTEKDKSLYTIRAVPFSDVKSIRRHNPTLGWQYIIIVLSSGLAFPPLYFYNGGVKEFLAMVKQHTFLVRSAEDANVFIVNDFRDPLQRTLSSLELPRAVSVTNSPSSSIGPNESSTSGNQENTDGNAYDSVSVSSLHNGRQRTKFNDPTRDLSINVLEKFSLVTRFARETTSQLFREAQMDGFVANQRRKNGKPSADHLHVAASDYSEEVPEVVPVAADPLEVKKLGLKVIGLPEPSVLKQKSPCRKETHDGEAATNVGTFELIECKEFDKMSLIWGKPRQPPLGPEEWTTFLDSEGRVMDPEALKKRIFYGGLEHNLRKEVWKFLLGNHAYDSTFAEREYLVSVKRTEYTNVKHQWQSISSEQARRFTKFRERKGLIEKDVVRTDRSLSFYDGDDNPNVKLLHDILLTYSFYNFDLGYCQGMSDLLSPILYVTRDEAESFWCFVSLMERLGPNFNRDQNGMHSQLFAVSKLVEILDSPLHNYFSQNDCLNYFFCFRWILIQFKREFEYEKTMQLWEVLWTHYLSEHLQLYVCVAILKRYRNKIMGEQMDFDTLLKFINGLSGHIDLDATLSDAEALCICAGENGAACIPPGTPPSLPIEDGSVYPQYEDDVL